MNRFYQDAIHGMDPTINPAGVEATMRLQFGTLNHLDQNVIIAEIKLAHECEREEQGFLKGVAESYGMAQDFDYWQDKLLGAAEGGTDNALSDCGITGQDGIRGVAG